MLSSTGSALLAHATDDLARAVEDLQFTLGEGPAIEARERREPVLVPDLLDPSSRDRTWPAFRMEVRMLGVRAFFAFPIQVGTVDLGSLDLYRRAPGELSPDQVAAGVDTGRALGSCLVTGDLARDDLNGYPMTVHRAAGMVMVQLGRSIDEAILRLRATAYLEGVAVSAVAQSVLEGRRRFAKEET